MFAPRPYDVAKEMVRVARPGGRVVMANWIPGDVFASRMTRDRYRASLRDAVDFDFPFKEDDSYGEIAANLLELANEFVGVKSNRTHD